MARTDLDSPGPLSSMPKDIYGAARLVAAVRDLQPPLPAKSLGVVTPIGQYLGAIGSRNQKRVSIARPIDGATLGWTLVGSGNAVSGETLAGHRLECRDASHHPCLGLGRDPPYSANRG